MKGGTAKQVRALFASKNANQRQLSSKVNILGRNAGPSTDVFGRSTQGGSRKPNPKRVLG